MGREEFTEFLAASAAGGARAAMLALIAQKMGSAGQIDVARALRAANELALSVEAPGMDSPILFDEGGQFISCRDTVITMTDCGPDIRLRTVEYDEEGRAISHDTEAPENHYRAVAARGVGEFLGDVCGESQWDWLARFASHMATLVRR